ncbi:hypothetical protein BGAL_0899g00010 [Botrytis galanthina]|uniref:Uncharacterized protein n=1 Tax=Botrytis galanthina TaxID=278940 RepID=A0A4V6T6S9_9HELO|nr:hypothetical protein BGAL_0899g00010 [Botrytis galanthina]
MSSSTSSLVLSRQKSNPYASLIASRRPAPAPVDVDFTVRLSVWQRGSRQTNSQLADLISVILQKIHERSESPNSWTATPLPRSIDPAGLWPQPTQVDISCRIMNILPPISSCQQEDRWEDHKGLVDFLFEHFQAHMSVRDYVKSIYSDRLIGFALNYPAIPNGETSYNRLDIQEFHLPEIKKWEIFKTKIVQTKFYHGPLLTLNRVTEVVKAYKEMTQMIPNGIFPNSNANTGLATGKIPLLKDLDRSSVDDLVHQYTPPVVRCMEEVLDALENMAMDTKSREPCPRQTCDVLSKIYQLKRSTPALTGVLLLLADKKAQQKCIWGTIAVSSISTLVVGGILFCAAPVAAPVAALTGSAMGSTAVVSTSVGAAVAETAALTATRAGLSYGVALKTMAGGAAAVEAGSSMTFIKYIKESQSNNTLTINQKINKGLETIVYYIALCFLKSNGIANPHSDDDQLTEILMKLYGRRPTQIAKKHYRAAYLHNLVENLAKNFRQVIVRLQKLGYAHLENMEWTSKPLITLEESSEDIERTFKNFPCTRLKPLTPISHTHAFNAPQYEDL